MPLFTKFGIKSHFTTLFPSHKTDLPSSPRENQSLFLQNLTTAFHCPFVCNFGDFELSSQQLRYCIICLIIHWLVTIATAHGHQNQKQNNPKFHSVKRYLHNIVIELECRYFLVYLPSGILQYDGLDTNMYDQLKPLSCHLHLAQSFLNMLWQGRQCNFMLFISHQVTVSKPFNLPKC